MLMNKYLKLSLMGAAGLGLFGVTFTMVAVFSGAPLHEVAGIGMFIDPPEGTEEVADGGSEPGTEDDAAAEPVSGTEALMRNAGLLGSRSLPAPFTGGELHNLQKELTDQIRENTLEREKLRVRELELDEREQHITDQYAELVGMRTKLEELESALDLRQAELVRDEQAHDEREVQGWKDLAELWEGGEAKDIAPLIADEEPASAAVILRELDEKLAGEILLELAPEDRRKYIDAYRQAAQIP